MTSLLVAASVLAAPGLAIAQESPDLEHFDTIEKAVESTKKSKKDIIVDFTGSDW